MTIRWMPKATDHDALAEGKLRHQQVPHQKPVVKHVKLGDTPRVDTKQAN